MRTFYLIVQIAFLAILSCQFAETTQESSCLGTWRLQSVKSNPATKINSDKLLQAANENAIVQEGMALSFFSDHQFTLIRGNGEYYFGKWIYRKEDQQISLHAGELHLVAALQGSGKDQHLLVRNLDGSGEWQFVLNAHPIANSEEDQFYPANNTWRIKPAALEDSAAIRNRLANYIQHMAYLLKSASLRDQSVVSFEFSMGPIRIYNGGLGVIPLNKVPDSWKMTFFNTKQAAQAYQLYGETLQQTNYKGASSGKWVEDDYQLMVALYRQLKQ